MSEQLLDRALVEEATKKSGLIWVKGNGAPALHVGGHGIPARAMWHVWHEGAAVLVGDGPGEQPLPGLVEGAEAEVTVRSKDKGGRLVTWAATVVELVPRSPEWEAAVAELKGKRLNAPDGEAMVERWARECRMVRLVPRAGETRPLPEGSLSAPPLPTPATTREPAPAGLPHLLFKKRRRG